MHFVFKEQIEDFIVEEVLEEVPYGDGESYYIFFEKRGINTMEVVEHLIQNLPLKREDIGIAGLKDKAGITRQRLSIYKKKIKQCWGIDQISHFLKQKVRLLSSNWHTEPLAVGKNKGNLFEIRLRKRSALNNKQIQALEEKIEEVKKSGFPNVFWVQRFWKGNKNYKKVEPIFIEGIRGNLGYEVRFKLQAFGSLWFNELLLQRFNNGKKILDWDIMVNQYNAFGTKVAVYQGGKLHHFDYWKCKQEQEKSDFFEPDHFSFVSDYEEGKWFSTGCVLGDNQLLAPTGSEGRKWDEELIKQSKFLPHGVEVSRFYKLYGFRRPLRVVPQSLEWKWDSWDLLLKFGLPTGAYASSLLSYLLAEIDPMGCVSNSLIIPRIKKDEN